MLGSSPHTRGALLGEIGGRRTASHHPRIRGEHTSGRPSGRGTRGSSPHTRGARTRRPSLRKAPRIIPAYAGSTSVGCPPMAAPADHPRIRGEHALPPFRPVLGLWIIPAYAGSTAASTGISNQLADHPRIRGEHRPVGPDRLVDRGSSPHTRGALSITAHGIEVYGDHPRIRGEHANLRRWRAARSGSSPHTRGALLHAQMAEKTTRIIPAYAGSTSPKRAKPNRCPDHPRIRGEHAVYEADVEAVAGSSPHTRGARRGRLRRRRGRRIIPAYAGSTSRSPRSSEASPDHPRIRGEHVRNITMLGTSHGSSPHTRGARGPGRRAHGRRRIIPAYAGSTPPSFPKSTSQTDHPRIRGEHHRRRRLPATGRGSSPHTRGAPCCARQVSTRLRIIPAYAGSTPISRPLAPLPVGSRIIPAYAGSTQPSSP